MALALFDLDNTLIAGDSDHGWGEFLCRHGHVDVDAYRARNDEFYAQYERGEMDVFEYLEFSLEAIAGVERSVLDGWHQNFMQETIVGMMLPKAQALVEKHREAGDELVVITSTQRFIVEPIVKALGIDELIATEPERQGDEYTGKVSGTPCFREGKITRLNEWLGERKIDLGEAYFYSDSINDLPLMLEVGKPVAVDPDEALKAHAEGAGWPVISLR